jgi:hypothetical protein
MEKAYIKFVGSYSVEGIDNIPMMEVVRDVKG